MLLAVGDASIRISNSLPGSLKLFILFNFHGIRVSWYAGSTVPSSSLHAFKELSFHHDLVQGRILKCFCLFGERRGGRCRNSLIGIERVRCDGNSFLDSNRCCERYVAYGVKWIGYLRRWRSGS